MGLADWKRHLNIIQREKALCEWGSKEKDWKMMGDLFTVNPGIVFPCGSQGLQSQCQPLISD